jgi:arylsulfatase A-like enzyme
MRNAWRPAALAALLVLVGCGRDTRPDVLLIVLDTVRADHLSLYGYERQTSPHLEALAKDGVLYRMAIAPGTWSVPSHASIFTGELPTAHGANRVEPGLGGIRRLGPDEPTLTRAMRTADYRTRAFVGNHGYLDPAFGFAADFERYDRENMRPAGKLAARAIAWLHRRRGRSVYLFINVMDAHAPYEPPPPYDRMFPGKLDSGFEHQPQMVFIATHRLPEPRVMTHYVSQYDGEIRYVDDRLGEIFAELKAEGRYDNALIVVTADHGELFGEHGAFGHGGKPWHQLVHVPLVIKYPHGARRGVVDTPVSLIDIAPTILATLGLPPLEPGQRPIWERQGLVVSEELTSDATERAAYDDDGRVLMESVAGGRRDVRLYDVRSDPGEEHPRDALADPVGARMDADLRTLLANVPRLPFGTVVHAAADGQLRARLRKLGYVE